MCSRRGHGENGSRHFQILGDTVQLEPIRTRLIARRDELATRAALAAADLRRENEPLSADFSEQAVQRENDEVLQGIGDAARSELAGIDRALRRIESGDYFKCARCGGAIEASRLEAVPHTDRCASCAREAR